VGVAEVRGAVEIVGSWGSREFVGVGGVGGIAGCRGVATSEDTRLCHKTVSEECLESYNAPRICAA